MNKIFPSRTYSKCNTIFLLLLSTIMTIASIISLTIVLLHNEVKINKKTNLAIPNWPQKNLQAYVQQAIMLNIEHNGLFLPCLLVF